MQWPPRKLRYYPVVYLCIHILLSSYLISPQKAITVAEFVLTHERINFYVAIQCSSSSSSVMSTALMAISQNLSLTSSIQSSHAASVEFVFDFINHINSFSSSSSSTFNQKLLLAIVNWHPITWQQRQDQQQFDSNVVATLAARMSRPFIVGGVSPLLNQLRQPNVNETRSWILIIKSNY